MERFSVVMIQAGVGVAVKAGAPKPDISTPEAFKRAVLAAKSIAYSRTGASGIIAAKLMDRLGLAEQLRDKTKLVDGVLHQAEVVVSLNASPYRLEKGERLHPMLATRAADHGAHLFYVAQIGGPPEYIQANWDRLVGTAQHLAELKAAG